MKVIDFNAARQFIKILCKPPKSSRLRAFYPTGHQFKAGDSGRKAAPDRLTVEQWQSEGRGVYLVINDGGDTDSEITCCRALFCEWDDRPKQWQIIAWQDLGLPEPTVQVDTGGKSIHSYWVFQEPIAPDIWRSLQKRLLEHADADRTLKNPSRVMRLPGTYHIGPDGAKGEQVCIIHQSDAYYTPQQLEACLPDEQTHSRLVQASQFTDYKTHSFLDIQDALNCIPSAVPKSGQYPFFRNLMWGLIQACEEAGGSVDQAIAMMRRHSPDFAEVEQVTLIGAVRRIFEPGCKHDYACVLMGDQGARKSSFWAALGNPFFSDALRDISSKDDLMVLHRSWIMEWAELDHVTGKKHAGQVKAFLSQSTDMFRVPYGKATEAFPRRCIIVGSTNRDSGFLVDETGNRRFWVIPVTCTIKNPIDVPTSSLSAMPSGRLLWPPTAMVSPVCSQLNRRLWSALKTKTIWLSRHGAHLLRHG
jgi:hypothetical protein